MEAYRLYLFGPPRLERSGRRVDLNLKKALALLAYLSVTEKPCTRDALTALFWPDSDQRAGRASLRRTLYRIHQAAGEDLVVADGETIGIAATADLWVDALDFSSRCTALDATPGGSDDTDLFAQAAALYGDDFLAGFHLVDCAAFDEWQFFEGERFQQKFVRLLDELVRRNMTAGRYDSALPHAHRRVALDPLDESAHRILIRLYGLTGQKGAAVRQFRECRRRLDRDLRATPQQETLDLIASIQHAPVDTGVPQPPNVPDIRYVKSGDVHIAYQVVGRGPVDFLFVSGFVSHLELIWEDPGLAAFLGRLAGTVRLILFDRRGVGLSDRIGYPPSLDDTVQDIHAVMDAVGSRQPVMMGVSEGGPVISLFAAANPEKVRGLIIYGSMAKGTWSPDYPWVLKRGQYDRWLANLVACWSEGPGIEGFAPTRLKDKRFRDWWARLLRFGSSPGMLRSVLEVLRDIDVRHVLPAIQAPTLVLHRKHDRAIFVENGRYFAREIPGATFRELEGSDHWWWVGDAEAVLDAIRAFLKDLSTPAAVRHVLATLCYGEMRGVPTGRKGEAERMPLVTEAVAQFGGKVVEIKGGRFLATFDGPSRALDFADYALKAPSSAGGFFRLGLHTGECTLRAGRPAGPAVQVAAQVMDQAGDGEAWLTEAVALLAAGSGHGFEERDRRRLEGVSGVWRLCALTPGRSSRSPRKSRRHSGRTSQARPRG